MERSSTCPAKAHSSELYVLIARQIAITRFFDGDADVVDPATESAVPPPQNTRRTEALVDSIPSRSSSSARHGLEPAPRVVATPESQMTQQAPLLLSLLFLPFNITYTIFSRIFGTVGYFFPIIPRLLNRLYPARGSRASRNAERRPLNSRDTAARFIREFEEEYSISPNTLPFFENGYAQAFDLAKRDLKYLLVVLVSPEHDDTAPFVRETLLSPDVVNFIKNPQNEIVLWAGSVQDSEAYQVSDALRVTKFPFAGLIVHTPSVSSTSMSMIAKTSGPIPPADFISKMQTAMQQRTEELGRARAVRREQETSRSILEQQNSAYERSLAQDRERARQRREAEAAREKAEREEREAAEAKGREARNLLQWKMWRAQSLPAEPPAEAKDVVRISIRMPSGDRVVRRFADDAGLEELYAFVECSDLAERPDGQSEKPVQEPSGYEHEYKFQLVSPMPREVYDLEKGGTLKSRIGRSGNLIVEKTVDDDDEEDEDEDEEKNR